MASIPVLRRSIATALSLGVFGGCTPPGTVSAGGNEAAAVAADLARLDQEMSDLEWVAEDQGGMGLQAIGIPAPGPGEVAATGVVLETTPRRLEVPPEIRAALQGMAAETRKALAERAKRLRQRAITRLESLTAVAKEGMQRRVVDNDLGGKTYAMTFEFTSPNGGTRKSTMDRIYNADRVLVSATQSAAMTQKNGRTSQAERTKELQADGSYKVTMTAKVILPNDKGREVSLTKTVAANGALGGSGTIKLLDGPTVTKTLTLTFGGSEEKMQATVTDPQAKVAATVEPTIDGGPDATATVVNTETHAVSEVAV